MLEREMLWTERDARKREMSGREREPKKVHEHRNELLTVSTIATGNNHYYIHKYFTLISPSVFYNCS